MYLICINLLRILEEMKAFLVKIILIEISHRQLAVRYQITDIIKGVR